MLRTIRAWTASIGVILMAAGALALLAGSPAQAADSPNTLTFNPPEGTDVLAPTVLTVGPCPATSDGYRATVSGPGVFAPGLQITAPQDVNFSTTSPFTVQLETSMLDLAKDNGATAVEPGYYLVTVECRKIFELEVVSTFTGYLHFTTATSYVTGPNVYPSSTVSPSTSASTSASPSASATTTATPDPTETTDPTTSPTTSTSPVASSTTLPVTGPPAGGIFIIGVVLVVLGGCVVLGTMRFDRPQPARW